MATTARKRTTKKAPAPVEATERNEAAVIEKSIDPPSVAPSEGMVLTLVGAEQYSITGYKGNPIRRYTQVTMDARMASHLLSQVARDPKTRTETPLFVEGVVARPRQRRQSADELMQALRGKAAENLNPNTFAD